MIDPEEVLETPRLLLEPLRAEHAGALFPLFRDARLYEFVPQDPPVSEARPRAAVRAGCSAARPRTVSRYG